jgi:hypothetical protein
MRDATSCEERLAALGVRHTAKFPTQGTVSINTKLRARTSRSANKSGKVGKTASIPRPDIKLRHKAVLRTTFHNSL